MNIFMVFIKHKEREEQTFAFVFNLMLLFGINDSGPCIPLKTKYEFCHNFFVHDSE